MSSILNIGNVGDINTLNVTDRLQDASGNLKNGEVHLGKKHYDVTFKDGQAEVKRHFYGFSGMIMSWFVKPNTATALQIQNKLNAVINSSDEKNKNTFQIISSNRAKLNEIISESGGKKVIEVADYGLKPNRDLVRDKKLVNSINADLLDEDEDHPQQINFNKIDGYNTVVGIQPKTLAPIKLPETLKAIEEGKLEIDPRVKQNKTQFNPGRVQAWTKFLARPENMAKINIPAKLYNYLHLEPGGAPVKQTGWEAAFRADKDKALKDFVLKNTPYNAKDVSEETVDFVVGKVKEYVEIFHMQDSQEKAGKMQEFFKKENWFGPYEQKNLEDCIAKYGEEGGKAHFDNLPIEKRQTYLLFTNIFTYSTFRQTSKLGLEFFREQGVPVMFQYADYSGKSLKGRENEITGENFWKDGYEAFKNKGIGGSAITHSELRHVFRLLNQPGPNGEKFNVKFAEGGKY